MAEYYDLPYTGAEVAAILAKVHDKDSLVEDAPSDGKEYVRKDGAWVDLGLGDLSGVMDVLNGEAVTVSLTNNQNADVSYSGTVVHVVYDSADHTYSVNGTSVVFVVPCNRSCTVSVVGDIENYKTPEAVTFTSGTKSERVVELAYQAEKVEVTLSVTNITEMTANGLTVTINGTAYTYDGTAITTLFPYGATYTISVDGGVVYTVPEASTYTAESASRNVTLAVTFNTGIYIQDTDGNLYTADTWDTANNANANGVAVVLDTCRFVILPDVDSAAQWASSASVNLSAINKTSEDEAKADYNGASNTTTMLTSSYCNKSGYAAYICANTTSKRGKTGYLGAAGEMYTVYQNRTAINSLLSLIGGTQISTSRYWVSNLYKYSSSKYYAWYVYMSNGNVDNYTVTSNYYVRVLTTL